MKWSIKDIKLRPLVGEPPWFLLFDVDPNQEDVRTLRRTRDLHLCLVRPLRGGRRRCYTN